MDSSNLNSRNIYKDSGKVLTNAQIWRYYAYIGAIIIMGLFCLYSNFLAQDIASARVMLSGQTDLYQSKEAIQTALHGIGLICLGIGTALIVGGLIWRLKRRNQINRNN